MKKSSIRHHHRPRRMHHAPPGSSPGVIQVPEDALKPVICCFRYAQDSFEEKQLNGIADIRSEVAKSGGATLWFDIRGLGDRAFLEQLADCFGIHRLQMEDVVNVYQRPKAEEYKEHLFLISRMMKDKDNCLVNDQLSLFLVKNAVISLQEKYEDLLDPVRDRVRRGKGYIRKYGADYLAYALMDASLDNFYPIMERIADRLDLLQDELLEKPSRDALNRVLAIKRELILIRRAIWSERDKVNDILRSNFPQISVNTHIFFRDSYDHCIQIMDLVESSKEVTASLMDVYHSSVSNKLNQVMKVLTIISTIFIPLTFIVGLYGMNFAHTDPRSGQSLPWNMPELYSPYGYVSVCIAMIVLVILQIIYFYKKGWLTKS